MHESRDKEKNMMIFEQRLFSQINICKSSLSDSAQREQKKSWKNKRKKEIEASWPKTAGRRRDDRCSS